MFTIVEERTELLSVLLDAGACHVKLLSKKDRVFICTGLPDVRRYGR